MTKKLLFEVIVVAFIGLFFVQTSIAVNPNWKQEQEQGFKELGVKPGEVYNAENWQGIEKALPRSVVEWVKKGEFTIKIGEMKYDYSPDKLYEGWSMANKGKYAIGDRDQVILAASGKAPDYIQGDPFPVIDWKNDPKAGSKIMHNNSLRKMMGGSTMYEFGVLWVSDQGLDRAMYAENYLYYLWNRPDGKPVPNPQKVKRFEMTCIKEPFDLSGAAMLYHYWLDGSPERFVQYIPALRRVKKMNVTDRSSPFFGTDFSNDDTQGYAGQPESMEWKVKEVKHILIAMPKWLCEEPDICEKLPGGGWVTPAKHKLEFGFDPKYKNEKYNIPWMPWCVNWVPRKVYVIGQYAKDPYYAYGDQEIWVDVDSNMVFYKIVWDKSGEYWKTLVLTFNAESWENGNRLSFNAQAFYVNVDDKTHHASIALGNQIFNNRELKAYINWPKNNPRIFKDEYMATMGR